MQARPTTKGPQEWVSAEGSLILGCLRPTGRFLMHFAEMCAVMCLGAAFLSILFFGGAALIGHPNLTQRLPELSTLVIALSLSLPMAAPVLRSWARTAFLGQLVPFPVWD